MSVGGSVIGYKLTLVNGETVVLGSEKFSDQAGLFSWGDPGTVIKNSDAHRPRKKQPGLDMEALSLVTALHMTIAGNQAGADDAVEFILANVKKGTYANN